MTSAGAAILKSRAKVTLTKPVTAPEKTVSHVGEISCDEVLFARLRELRKRLADERDVPAYIVFSDVALRQMARNYPANERDFSRISGVGEKKLHEFGAAFLGEIGSHLETNARQIFADDSFSAPPAPPPRKSLGDSARDTLRRFRSGQSVEQIAQDRDVTTGTIMGHIAEGVERGEPVDLAKFFTTEEKQKMFEAFDRNGFGNIVGVFEALGGKIDYGKLRIFRAAANAKRA